MSAVALPALPVVLPLLAGALLLLLPARLRGAVQAAALAGLLVVALALLSATADGEVLVHLAGDWPAPVGIVLVADRLSSLMVALVAVLGVAVALAAGASGLSARPHFRALLQFQLAGLAGAFLTGDLFNLFVFFEVLLAASYGLLVSGPDAQARAGNALRYLVVNLLASALFLVAAALVYGVTGTLNLADLAVRVPQVPPADRGLLEAAGWLLAVVFAVKAALFPLGFWLISTYRAATAPVAALFAVMTKVGVVSLLRVHGMVFGAAAGDSAQLVAPVLLWAGLATVAVATAGLVRARTLPALGAALVAGSSGLLVSAAGLSRPAVDAGLLFYLLSSTLAAALFFLLAARIARLRPRHGHALVPGEPVASVSLGLAFIGCAMVLAGLPPMPGFLGKVAMLSAAIDARAPGWQAVLAAQLAFGLACVATFARAGAFVFWGRHADTPPASAAAESRPAWTAACLLLGVLLLVQTLAAGPLARHLAGVADALHQPADYLRAVLDASPVVQVVEPPE